MGIISVGIDNPITFFRKPANEVIHDDPNTTIDDYFYGSNLLFPAIDALYELELILNYTGHPSAGIRTSWGSSGLTFETLRFICGPAWGSISPSNTHTQMSRISCGYDAEYGASANMAGIMEKFHFSTTSSAIARLSLFWGQFVQHDSNLTVYAQSTIKVTRIE